MKYDARVHPTAGLGEPRANFGPRPGPFEKDSKELAARHGALQIVGLPTTVKGRTASGMCARQAVATSGPSHARTPPRFALAMAEAYTCEADPPRRYLIFIFGFGIVSRSIVPRSAVGFRPGAD